VHTAVVDGTTNEVALIRAGLSKSFQCQTIQLKDGRLIGDLVSLDPLTCTMVPVKAVAGFSDK
jgi:hypothetical protein